MKLYPLLFSSLLAVSTNISAQQPSRLKAPLQPVAPDSIVLLDFFWDGIIRGMEQPQPSPSSNLSNKLEVSSGEFEAKLKLWNSRRDSLNIVGGIGSLALESEMQAKSALRTFNEAIDLSLLTGHGSFVNVAERALYNGVCSGLFSKEENTRAESERTIRGVKEYIYATQGDNLYANLYIQNQAHVVTEKMDVRIEQINDMPWFSSTILKMSMDKPQRIKVHLHIPEWVAQTTLPHHSLTGKTVRQSVSVNNQLYPAVKEDGYYVIDRLWNDSDKITLTATMPIQRLRTDLHSGVALQRGPFVYCLRSMGSDQTFDNNTPIGVHYDKEVEHAEILTGNLIHSDGTKSKFLSVPYFSGWKNGTAPHVWLKE